MKMKTTYVLKHRRRREKKTDYEKRLAMLKSKIKRFVIRKSNSSIRISLVETINASGDKTINSMNSKNLKEFKWMAAKNMPSAYLIGYAFGLKLIKDKFNEEAIADIGLVTPLRGSKVFAAIKGLKDAGINIKASEEAFPSEDRLKGKTIEDYAKKLDENAFNKKFSVYAKENFDVKNLSKKFDETKKLIENKFKVA